MFACDVIDGKFISNNLLVVLTLNSLEICNVSEAPQHVHQFKWDKFSYVDFFLQEEGLNFDKNLIKKNLLRTFN